MGCQLPDQQIINGCCWWNLFSCPSSFVRGSPRLSPGTISIPNLHQWRFKCSINREFSITDDMEPICSITDYTLDHPIQHNIHYCFMDQKQFSLSPNLLNALPTLVPLQRWSQAGITTPILYVEDSPLPCQAPGDTIAVGLSIYCCWGKAVGACKAGKPMALPLLSLRLGKFDINPEFII